MSKKRILVTGTGGNVGQGIARNIKADFPDIHLVGCNIIAFTAGNHLCESNYLVPYSYDEGYIELIKEIVIKENIDLVIPSTDYEIYFLSKHAAEINAVIAASGEETTGIYLDKYKTWLHHNKYNIPFAKAYLPSEYNNEFKDFIAKPKKGRGSRGLHINPKEYAVFSDDEYMIQELHKGDEITTAFYVDKENTLLGHITLQRQLENGNTVQCKVVKEYDLLLEPIIQAMIRHGDFKGSANLQSIVTKDREIMPFEVNCRISGTNSIRGNFGFKDVKYTVQEYLYNIKPDKPVITMGISTRILMDVIYPGVEEYEQCINNNNHFNF